MEELLDQHPDYITTTQGMRGYFAVWLRWYKHDKEDEMPGSTGVYEPLNSSDVSHATREEAAEEAKWWAEDNNVEYRP